MNCVCGEKIKFYGNVGKCHNCGETFIKTGSKIIDIECVICGNDDITISDVNHLYCFNCGVEYIINRNGFTPLICEDCNGTLENNGECVECHKKYDLRLYKPNVKARKKF